MRMARIKVDGRGCYHVVSRIVDRNFRLDSGEKEIFVRMMRRVEAFSGVKIITFAIMSNHFHFLVDVPEVEEVDYDELLRRMRILYGDQHVNERLRQWELWRNMGMEQMVEDEQARLRARMYDISAFMKTMKQRYSISYNSRYKRRGTLWEERFKSVVVENTASARAAVAAYIDLNPVRAKLVEDPGEYRWSGYGEACAGVRRSSERLAVIYEDDRGVPSWQEVAGRYRMLLYVAGEERHVKYGDAVVKSGLAHEEVERVLQEGGRLSLAQVLRCRVRYFSAGVALGSREFVDGVFKENRGLFSVKRQSGARAMRYADWGGLRTMRALRVEVVTT